MSLFSFLRNIRNRNSDALLRSISIKIDDIALALGQQGASIQENSTWVPPGHFYSPIVDTNELRQRAARVFDRSIRPEGVDLRDEKQLAFLQQIKRHFSLLPFTAEPQTGLRYFYENPAYSYGDAIILSCILMEFKPSRLIEIGSGYSSCVALDVNELFLDGALDLTFIEPYPELLLSLMKPYDAAAVKIVPTPIQDLDLTIIDSLQAGDLLFIDSTHVSKTGSDVNFEFFNILPRLKSGVYIHFHDIFYPFEYPENWALEENRSWNELYLMRAFLTGNSDFDIVFFNHFMSCCYHEEMNAALPLFKQNPGGGLWLRKR